MRPLMRSLVVSVLVGVPVVVQAQLRVSTLGKYSGEEVHELRKVLGLSDLLPITLAESKIAPPGDPLKIYVRSILDSKVQNEFVKRIDYWNKHDASKYGRLEVVNRATEADLMVVWVIRALPPEDLDIAIKSHAIVVPDVNPAYSYLVARTPEGLDIIWRDFRFTNAGKTEVIADILQGALNSRLKGRLKVSRK